MQPQMQNHPQKQQRHAVLVVCTLILLFLCAGFLIVRQQTPILPMVRPLVLVFIPCLLIFLVFLFRYLLTHDATTATHGSAHFATKKDINMLQSQHQQTPQKPKRGKPKLALIIGTIILVYVGDLIYQVFTKKDQLFPEMRTNPVAFNASMILLVVVIVILVFWGFIIWGAIALIRTINKGKTGPDNTHGSAHFAEANELDVLRRESDPRQGVLLGVSNGQDIRLSTQQQENHVLVIAPSGKGKTSSIIIPALLNEFGTRSLVINDVKHELIDKVAGALARYHTTYVFSPTNPAESNGYNPLAHISSMKDAIAIAKAIIRNTSGESNERFWDDATELLLVATMMHLHETEPRAPFSRLAEILTQNSLQAVSDLLCNSPSQSAKRTATSFMTNVQNNPKLSGSIMVDIASRMFHMMDEHIEQVTAYDELDFTLLANEPSALFLHIPPADSERLRWLSGCLLMQFINHLSKQKHLLHVAFYLDELANAGYIPGYLEYISYIRSAGVAFLQVIQDFGQLERLYEKHGKDTILANSSTKMFLAGVGQVEAEFASRVMGTTTVQSESYQQESWLFQSSQVSYSQASRSLMFPDEIRTLPAGMGVVIIDNLPPLVVQMFPYFRQPHLMQQIGHPFKRASRRIASPTTSPKGPFITTTSQPQLVRSLSTPQPRPQVIPQQPSTTTPPVATPKQPTAPQQPTTPPQPPHDPFLMP